MPARIGVRGAAAMAVVLALMTVAAPAAAHDELIASSPAANAQLDTAPAEVELVFSAEIMQIGAAVIVAGPGAEDWIGGDPVVEFDTLTVPLAEGMPDGAYEIRWRVVSSDGHPISGLVPFTVGDVPAGSPGVDAAADDETDSTTAESASAQDGGIPRAVWIGAIGAASALTLFALVLFFLRGRDRRVRGGSDGEPRQN